MVNTARWIGVCAVAAVLAAGVLLAQTPLPAWTQLTIIHVNPALVDEYISAQKDFTAHAKKLGSPVSRTGGRIEVGDNYRFIFLSPAQNMASFDAAVRNTDAELAGLNARIQKYITGQESFVFRNLQELDNPLPSGQQPAMMLINIAKVAPGREQDYLNVMKSDFLPHFNKANFYHVNGSLTFGSDSGFIHIFYINNFARLDEGSPVAKALGAAGAQAAAAKLAGIVTSSEQWIVRVNPDFTYGASSRAVTAP